MLIQNKLLKRGFSINLLKDARLEYPKGVWESLSRDIKKTIIDNLVYLKVSPYSMFHDKEMFFDFSLPHLKELGDKGVTADIPKVAEEDNVSTEMLIEKFRNKKIRFRNNDVGLIDKETREGAVIGLSFGKDSLLSYGVAKEIGLKTKLVFVQDCWDAEMVHKLLLLRRFEQEFDEKVGIMYDEIDDISTYKRINVMNSEGIVGSNAMNGYMVMLLPFVFSGADKIIFGNEQNFNDFFVNKDGHKCYPSFDQSSEWMIQQNKALGEFTNGKIKVMSFIEPLYNIAEVKVLFNRYPNIAKYQMSCGLSGSRSRKERWCYSCPMCAKAFLYLRANNIDPKVVNFSKDMFEKEFERFYPLFGKPTRVYEKPKAIRDEQLFAFYMAYKNGSKGYLIDMFKERFLKEAISREDELYNKFFKIHDAVSIPSKLKKEIESIYKEELRCP